MRRIHTCLELSDELYQFYERRAQRMGISVEALMEKVLRGLVERVDEEGEEEEDHPIFIS